MSTHRDAPAGHDVIAPVTTRQETIDQFAQVFDRGIASLDMAGELSWLCGIRRHTDSAEIWLLGRVAPAPDSPGLIAAFPVATSADAAIAPESARSELVWYLANRIHNHRGPLMHGDIPDVIDVSTVSGFIPSLRPST